LKKKKKKRKMAAAQKGIQQLLDAENQASGIVAKARKGK
jgi:hypothetical protein